MTDDLSQEEKEILDGTVWNRFCDTLKMAGNVVHGAEHAPSDPLNRMEGFRYSQPHYRRSVEERSSSTTIRSLPCCMRVVHETAKMGADHPDNYYQNASISGEHEYRIRGNRGTVHYLGFFTQIGNYGQGRGMPPSGYLEASSLESRAGTGTSRSLVSTEEKPGNWLPMKKETGTLIVRQTFLDRENENARRARHRAHRRRWKTDPRRSIPVHCADGMTDVRQPRRGRGNASSPTGQRGSKRHTNKLPRYRRRRSVEPGGWGSRHRVLPQLLEAGAGRGTRSSRRCRPECEHWNFQLNNYWMESLDYRYYPSAT